VSVSVIRSLLPAAAACLLTLLTSGSALACSVCFGPPDSSLTQGAKAGVLILMGVIAAVLSGIAGVALFWARRARTLESREGFDPAGGQRAQA